MGADPTSMPQGIELKEGYKESENVDDFWNMKF